MTYGDALVVTKLINSSGNMINIFSILRKSTGNQGHPNFFEEILAWSRLSKLLYQDIEYYTVHRTYWYKENPQKALWRFSSQCVHKWKTNIEAETQGHLYGKLIAQNSRIFYFWSWGANESFHFLLNCI